MRKIKKRAAKPAVCLVVDGETEAWYLKQMRQAENLSFPIKPELLAKKALAQSFEEVRLKANDYDKVYWIVDTDEIIKNAKQNEFRKYISELEKLENVVTVVNVPCLEFWYLLHYGDTDKFFASYNELLPLLRKKLTDYVKTEKYYFSGSGIYQKLKPMLCDALHNSKKHKFDVGNMETGISEMWKIFDDFEIKR